MWPFTRTPKVVINNTVGDVASPQMHDLLTDRWALRLPSAATVWSNTATETGSALRSTSAARLRQCAAVSVNPQAERLGVHARMHEWMSRYMGASQ